MVPTVALLLLCLLSTPAEARIKKRAASARNIKQAQALPATLNPALIDDRAETSTVGPDTTGETVIRVQVLLDRAHFSPGEIDGRFGPNLLIAISGFQRSRKLPDTGVVDASTWAALNADTAPVIASHTITKEDVSGPFEKIPPDMMEKATLKSLGYESPLEALAEKFHVNPRILAKLNPGKAFERAGEQLAVPNVTRSPLSPATAVFVDGKYLTVSALDASGNVLAQYPATAGSEHDPLPVGQWKILGVVRNPKFRYNPDLFWDADPAHSKAILPPGPNSPVGVVWIDLSKEHYGIHGTPEPSRVGHTQSHGCIRLTNWDAAELAGAVKRGTPAVLEKR
jgi:lipoprotein-anchoring transpeptidase ErfK/SrfK